MSLLTFTVNVDVPDYHPTNWVPYVKERLLRLFDRSFRVKSVSYEEWLSEKANAWAEMIEKDADDRGELTL